jgi:hypothetical protein
MDAADCDALEAWARDAGEPLATYARRMLKSYIHARQLREREGKRGRGPADLHRELAPLGRRLTLWMDTEDRDLLNRFALDDDDPLANLVRRVLHNHVMNRRLRDGERTNERTNEPNEYALIAVLVDRSQCVRRAKRS